MSRFRVINGSNVTSIAQKDGEIKKLEYEIQRKLNPSNKDLVVYAYHFVRLGNLLLAQKYLNKLSSDYFDTGVYKDLSHALLVWSMNSAVGGSMRPNANRVYEYFIILKRVTEMFHDVNFISKPAFYRFKRQLNEFAQSHLT